MSIFGDRIKQIRVANKKTLREVAQYLGVGSAYLSNVEHGRKNPFGPIMIGKYAKLFDCSADELSILAVNERSKVEILLADTKDSLFNEAVFAFARRADSNDVNDELSQKILDILKK